MVGSLCDKSRALGAALVLLALDAAAALAQIAAPDSTAADSTATAVVALHPVWAFLKDLFDISAQDLGAKGMRILVILLIVAVARLFMLAVQKASRWVVYSNWGPLKYIFRDHQRSITVHNLLISLTKYVVYFMALGYILAELGVDYRAYLASLSLIGIAVGFGSQGLVQDVVTGFFILFENQFKVGDMVEVSGQVGVVESIGLRTTRIHNYFGASVVLQNRNISTANRFPKGAYEVVVDVAIADAGAAERAGELLGRIGAELHGQFRGIILRRPEVKGLLELKTGECFVRLYLEIWPVQLWVIDAQLVPRIREIFKREGVEVPGDRVIAFYHLEEDKDILSDLRKIRNQGADQRRTKD